MLRLECALTCPGSAAIAAWYAASAPSRSPRSSQQDNEVGVRVGAPRLRRNRRTVGRHRAVEVSVIPVILQQDAVQDVRADEVMTSCHDILSARRQCGPEPDPLLSRNGLLSTRAARRPPPCCVSTRTPRRSSPVDSLVVDLVDVCTVFYV
jgi:hypothetical protein